MSAPTDPGAGRAATGGPGAGDRPRLLITTSVPTTLTAFLLPFAEHYRALGWRVDAATNGGPDCAACVEAFDRVHHVPWTRNPLDPVNLVASPRVLRRLAREHRYHLVHSHDPIASFVMRYALRDLRRTLGLRTVYTAHGFHFFEGGSRARNLAFGTLERVASRWTDVQVVINHEDLKAARAFYPDPARVVYMPGIGVDTGRYDPGAVSDEDVRAVRRELGLAPEQRLLLMVAEFNPGKRHLDAVEAVARCGREVVIACAGVGPLEGAVRERARALGIEDRVRLLGFRRDIPALLRASMALILPSEREGLPRCIMEASCLERPVIATAIRGVTELVDERTGIVTAVGDADAMADAIRRLVDEPDTARAMGLAGREKMRDFDLTHVLRLHDELYARVLTELGRPDLAPGAPSPAA